MYKVPVLEDFGVTSCDIHPMGGEEPSDYTFNVYDVDIKLNDKGKVFTPFGFRAMTSESILNVLQLEGYRDIKFLSRAWKEAYYILTIKELENWALALKVSMLIIQTTDKVALEALLERDFRDFTVINNNSLFSVSGRKWYRVRR